MARYDTNYCISRVLHNCAFINFSTSFLISNVLFKISAKCNHLTQLRMCVQGNIGVGQLPHGNVHVLALFSALSNYVRKVLNCMNNL